MSFSASDTALLLLDLQNEMVDPAGKVGAHGLAAAVAARGVLANAAKVLAAARSAGLMIVHVRLGFRRDYADCLSVAPRIANLKANGAAQLGTWGTEFPAMVQPLESEFVITKQCTSPFFNTPLMHLLLIRGIKKIALGGVATNLAVESATRAGDDAGFAVTVLQDLCAAPNAEWHAFSVERILPVFGTVSDSAAFTASVR
jgi:biuret amidohydrolase